MRGVSGFLIGSGVSEILFSENYRSAKASVRFEFIFRFRQLRFTKNVVNQRENLFGIFGEFQRQRGEDRVLKNQLEFCGHAAEKFRCNHRRFRRNLSVRAASLSARAAIFEAARKKRTRSDRIGRAPHVRYSDLWNESRRNRLVAVLSERDAGKAVS